jgi:uncharacterized membrane protein YidH (DUF202 family)
LAYERTLMAWVRTAASMISFGFSIYKLRKEKVSVALCYLLHAIFPFFW